MHTACGWHTWACHQQGVPRGTPPPGSPWGSRPRGPGQSSVSALYAVGRVYLACAMYSMPSVNTTAVGVRGISTAPTRCHQSPNMAFLHAKDATCAPSHTCCPRSPEVKGSALRWVIHLTTGNGALSSLVQFFFGQTVAIQNLSQLRRSRTIARRKHCSVK